MQADREVERVESLTIRRVHNPPWSESVPNKILVLEDDADLCGLLQQMLQAQGHEVLTASSVARGMTLVRNEEIDLAIVDIMMPIVDGYQFCAWLRKREEHADTPIIILTAHEARYGRERAEALGVRHFLNKPFQPEDLKAAIADALGAGGD
jgi:DNA-binding response OmpR family regulator